jgi:hypothetical protein
MSYLKLSSVFNSSKSTHITIPFLQQSFSIVSGYCTKGEEFPNQEIPKSFELNGISDSELVSQIRRVGLLFLGLTFLQSPNMGCHIRTSRTAKQHHERSPGITFKNKFVSGFAKWSRKSDIESNAFKSFEQTGNHDDGF